MSAVTDRVSASDVRVIARLLAAVRQRMAQDDRDRDDRHEAG